MDLSDRCKQSTLKVAYLKKSTNGCSKSFSEEIKKIKNFSKFSIVINTSKIRKNSSKIINRVLSSTKRKMESMLTSSSQKKSENISTQKL